MIHTSTPLLEIKTPNGAVYRVSCNATELSLGRALDNDLIINEPAIADRLRITIGTTIEVEDPDPRVQETYTLTMAPLQIGRLWLRILPSVQVATTRSQERQRYSITNEVRTELQQRSQYVYQNVSRRWGTASRLLQHRIIRALLLALLIVFAGVGLNQLFDNDKQQWERVSAVQLMPIPTGTSTSTPTPFATPTSTASNTPSMTPSSTATATPTPSATPTLTPFPNTTAVMLPLEAPLVQFGTRIEPATVGIGQDYWKVVGVQWLRGAEANGVSNIFVEVLTEADQRDIAQWVLWLDFGGQPIDGSPTGQKPNEKYACDFPIFNAGPALGVKVQGPLPSEAVRGLGGDPGGSPSSFFIKFKRTKRIQ